MKMVRSMQKTMKFEKKHRENRLYYAESGSSRLQNRAKYAENGKNAVF